jgi:DNA-binding transcriptional LysR family regulator
LEGFRKIEDQVRKAKDRVTGRVRVAAIYSVGLLQMDAYVKQFEERYPETELQLEYLHPEEVYDRVLQDAADIGLVSFPKDGGEIGCIPWLEQEMVLVVPPVHRLAGEDWVNVSEMNGEKFVGFTTELTIRRQVDRWLRQAKVSVHVVHEFDNVENIKRAVEIGAGIALLPLPSVRREWESGSLWAVKLSLDHHAPDRPLWTRPLGIVHKRHKTLSTAANKFVELLHEEPELLPGFSPLQKKINSQGIPSRRQTVS